MTNDSELTLESLRKNVRLTLQGAIDLIREIDPEAPKTAVGLKHIEDRGCDRLPFLRACAQVYGVSLDVAEKAARRKFPKSKF